MGASPELPAMKPIAHLSEDELGQALHQSLQALPDAPAALQRAAIALLPPGGLPTLAQTLLTRIAAVLSFDSWATPALAGGMRALRSPTRHLLFSAEGRDIDLRISPAADAFSLAGQVLGPDDSGSIELLAHGAGPAPARVTQLDALGEFRIEGLDQGRYTLTLRLGGEQIVLPPIDVGGPGGEPGH